MTDSDRRRTLTGYALALGAAASVAMTPVASKVLLGRLHVFTFGAVWFATAGTFALGTLLLRGRGRELALRGRRFWAAALVGITNGLSGFMFFRAVQLADPALVGFFTRPGTILTVLAGVLLFGEHLSRLEWIAIAIVVSGSSLLGYTANAIELRAFVLVIAATTLTSASYSFAKGAVASIAPIVVVAYRAWFTSAIFAVAALAAGKTAFPVGGYLWALPVGAFMGPFFSFVLLFGAFDRLPLSHAASVQAIYPVFTTVYAALIVGSVLTGSQLAGGLMATFGIGLLVYAKPPSAAAAAERVELEGAAAE